MSKNNFLITGLPRSRTAWLSVAATGPKSICHHEPVSDHATYADFCTLLSDDRFEHVGVSDSALVLQIGRLIRDHDMRVLIVVRHPSDVGISVRRYFGDDLGSFDVEDYCQTMSQHLSRHVGDRHVRYVNYDDLRDVRKVKDALAFVMRGAAPSPLLPGLMRLNIQRDKRDVLEAVRAGHSNWHMDRSWERENA